MYTITLNSVGNPDHGQYAAVSNPVRVQTNRLAQLIQSAADYIQTWNLGAGNWPVPIVYADGVALGRLTYNLKLVAR